MAKVLTNAVKACLFGNSRPIELFEFFCTHPFSSPSHRYANYREDVTFAGQTWSKIGIGRGKLHLSSSGKIDSVKMDFDNVNLSFSTLIKNTEFRRRRVRLTLVFADELGNANNKVVMYDGKIEDLDVDLQNFSITVKNYFSSLGFLVPRRLFQTPCNYKFCDSWCTLNADTYKTSGSTVATGTVSKAYLSAGVGVTWTPGILEVTSGHNEKFYRPILTIAAAGGMVECDVAIPFPGIISSGVNVTVRKYCDKALETCSSDFSNRDNFGGFYTIPERPYI